MIPERAYGDTGVRVSALGLGAMQLGEATQDQASLDALLAQVLDAGIRLLDTAPSYGRSEWYLGHWLRHHRQELTISTKLGYGVAGIEDWSAACITAGVDQALQRLQVEWIDIAHLHSCPLHILRQDSLLRALEDAKSAGKVRAMAYSGEGEALDFALDCGRFDGVMASLNLFDQRVLDQTLPRLGKRGFIAKRPLANAPWQFDHQPRGRLCETYWLRRQQMALPDPGMAWGELAIRFAVWQPGVSSAIVGTSQAGHLRECLDWAARGPLPADLQASLRDAFKRNDQDWVGQL